MSNNTVRYELTINNWEAKTGTKKVIVRKSRHLEITIPAGVKTGTLVKLSGALLITDGYYGDILIHIKVKRRYRPGVIAGVAIACFFIVMYFLPAEDTFPTEDTSGYVYTNGGIECGGDGEPIELINNTDATNPTYAQLVAFIAADSTDTNNFLEGGPRDYVCSDFAEDVHNNAEAAGIRVAWVGIDLVGEDEGHACNAFETIDKGLVYVDCTGGNALVYVHTIDKYVTIPSLDVLLNPALIPEPEPTTWDTIAYVKVGEEYGCIAIAQAKSLSYSFYEEYKQKWQEFEARLEAYNREVERYNQEISGKVYTIGSAEDIRMSVWEARLEEEGQALDKLFEELGEGCYEEQGIVEDIYIHW